MKTESFVAGGATGGETTAGNAGLPEFSPRKNWVEDLAIESEATEKTSNHKGSRRPSIVELLDRAEGFRAALDRGGVNQADLARRNGITRARVTQLLNLLGLAPEVRAEVRRLVGTGVKVSERSLRPLVGKPVRTQQRAIARLAAGAR